MKQFSLILLLFITQMTFGQTNETGSFQFGGLERDYIVHLPPNFDGSESLPMVFNLHGLTSNATEQMFYSEMNVISDAENFIVCYANGVNNSWNVSPFTGSTVDDTGFLNALIDTLHTNYNIDLNRVYSCGMSNGGYMSYKLACELSDRVTAVASVTGSMFPGTTGSCTPTRPVPVMQIHGTADFVVPYDGNFIALPIEEVLDLWLDFNECVNAPDTIEVPDIDPDDETTALRIEWNSCDEGSEMLFFRIEGGGHTWPGSSIITGVTNQDFEASVEIWEFFNQFNLDGPISSTVVATNEIDLTISPNPARGMVTVSGDPSDWQEVYLVHANGQVVWQSADVKSEQLQIDISGFSSGMYYVMIETVNGRKAEKLMVF